MHTRQQSFDEAITKRNHTERHSEPHTITPSVERDINVTDSSFSRQMTVEAHILQKEKQ